MIPDQLRFVPVYLIERQLGLITREPQNYLGVILILAIEAQQLFLMRQYFLSIPRDLEEAAKIDGAGAATTFVRIVAPLAKPAYAAAGLLMFLFSWGQFLWPVMVTRTVDVRPLPMGIAEFQGLPPTQWGDVMAYAAMMVIPLLIVFIIFQRQFVQGVATSGLKG
jgi:multiple sugar transport system permease protein